MENKIKHTKWVIYTDGASRGNPGKAAVGVVIYKDDIICEEFGCDIGNATNNQAEYMGLIAALLLLKKRNDFHSHDFCVFYLDSLLVVQQLNGVFAVKNKELRILYEYSKKLIDGIKWSMVHIERAKNVKADTLANKGIDEKIKPPLFLEHPLRMLECIHYPCK